MMRKGIWECLPPDKMYARNGSGGYVALPVAAEMEKAESIEQVLKTMGHLGLYGLGPNILSAGEQGFIYTASGAGSDRGRYGESRGNAAQGCPLYSECPV